jgi:pyruvate/2-oxoacid:ferredoxin oxidoreductase alpha subunit
MGASLAEGNEAIGWGAPKTGCTFFAGYPITPATPIYNTMLTLLPPSGGICLHGEDEIASNGSEIPIEIVDVQGLGPSAAIVWSARPRPPMDQTDTSQRIRPRSPPTRCGSRKTSTAPSTGSPNFEEFRPPGGRTLLVTHGVTARAAKVAAEEMTRGGRPISLLVLKTLWPVPQSLLREKTRGCSRGGGR